MNNSPEYSIIFIVAGGLQAFTFAFYALLARERKTPYITESLYKVSILLILTVLLTFLSSLTRSRAASISDQLYYAGILFLLFAFAALINRIWRIYNRQINFRDDKRFLNLKVMRWIKLMYRRNYPAPDWTTNPLKLSRELLKSLRDSEYIAEEQLNEICELESTVGSTEGFDGLSISLGIRTDNVITTNRIAADLAYRVLEQDGLVQYTSASRHPIEFVSLLRKQYSDDNAWKKLDKQIVLIDAFSPHFGFVDSVCDWKGDALEKEHGIKLIRSKPTYAGVHSSNAKAFNKLKSNFKDDRSRKPTLVIYEDLHSLMALESQEQYHVFLRHVIPSERLWGGMISLFLECRLADRDFEILSSLVDINHDRLNEAG